MKTDHSPLPWHVGIRPGPIVYGPKGEQIVNMMTSPFQLLLKKENTANALFIERAVNSHYQLVDAAERLVERINCWKKGVAEGVEIIALTNELAAALELAKKGLNEP